MTDYLINKCKHTFSFRPTTGEITIGCYNLDLFSDNQLIEFISDCLTHEHMHKILFELFDNTVSSLFDGIEYLFRNDKLHNEHLKGSKRFTYQTFIKKCGYDKFLRYYGLDYFDVLGANILCNTRRETMLQHGGL